MHSNEEILDLERIRKTILDYAIRNRKEAKLFKILSSLYGKISLTPRKKRK